MKIDKNYLEFIQSIKKQIVQSRYIAAFQAKNVFSMEGMFNDQLGNLLLRIRCLVKSLLAGENHRRILFCVCRDNFRIYQSVCNDNVCLR